MPVIGDVPPDGLFAVAKLQSEAELKLRTANYSIIFANIYYSVYFENVLKRSRVIIAKTRRLEETSRIIPILSVAGNGILNGIKG